MLFDLSSPGRKRIIRVVYGLLAVLFLVGFVGFGVGGSFGGGGILDALGITDSNGSSASGDSALQAQIDSAQKQAKKNPANASAQTELVNLHFRQAVAKFQQNQNIDDARPDLEAAVSAWEAYLKTNPKKPSVAAAPFAAQSYAAIDDLKGAAKAQRVVVDAHPQVNQYLQLAAYYYADQNFKQGEKTATEAANSVKNKKTRAKVEKQFAKLEKKAKQQAQLLKAQQKAQGGSQAGKQALENPTGALGGGTSSPLGGSPTGVAP